MKYLSLIIFFLFIFIFTALSQDDNSDKIKVINPGPPLNLKDYDYAPSVTSDGKMLFFVSSRKESFISEDGNYSHDIFVAVKNNKYDSVFQKIIKLDASEENKNSGINTYLNEGTACISSDNKLLFFVGCNRGYGFGDCDIYMADINIGSDTIKILNIYLLGTNVNSKFWESQPSISPDNKRLYFVSNRPIENSFNNFNIWYSDYDEETASWGKSKNIEQIINTKDKECSPLICADNKTLIFASNGHSPNYGGLDFYYSVRDSADNWSKPVNMGKPFSTKEDDWFMSIVESGDVAYFSSRDDSKVKNYGSSDILMAIMPPLYEIRDFHVIMNDYANLDLEIYDKSGKQINVINMFECIPGNHIIPWDGLDSSGNPCPPGVYYYKVLINNVAQERIGTLIIK